MAKFRDKKYIEQNVYEAAKDRIRKIYKEFDEVVVSFSAGKDSTAVLTVVAEIAEELGKLPLRVAFFDEEAIHPPTIEYAIRVAKDPRFNFEWYCLEFMHRNACSNEEPYWYCWDKDKKDKWVRELPTEIPIITEHPDFHKGMTMQEFVPFCANSRKQKTIMLNGIRTQESLRRYQTITMKKEDSYIGKPTANSFAGYPIYDWSSEDVWTLVKIKNLDYNRTYDVMNQTSMYNKLLGQRVCPPFGEEPLRGLWMYSECFPEMWHKMLDRVDGVATAWRYANTELYLAGDKPDNLTWKQHTMNIIDSIQNAKTKAHVKKNINAAIKVHFKRTNDPILDNEPHIISGASWRFFAKLAVKGDFKGRTIFSMINQSASMIKKSGLNIKEVKAIYGKNTKARKEYEETNQRDTTDKQCTMDT